MQQENLELVRSTFEAICDRDYRRAEAGFDDEGEDVVALAAHTVGRASASGAPVDVRWGIACRVASGKISRVDVYGDWAKAVNAVASEG